MNQMKVVVLFVLSAIFTLASIQQSAADNMPTFAIVVPDDYKEMLVDDADALDLDISNAKFSITENGLARFATEQFEISRDTKSGEFVYFNKAMKRTEYPVDKEPTTKEEIETNARNILDSFGIDEKELLRLSVKRKLVKSVERGSTEATETVTTGYLVYALRKIDDYPVNGSRAKIIFNAEGELNQIVLNWRSIDRNPLRTEEVIDQNQLKQTAVNAIVQRKGAENLQIHSAFLGYNEKVSHTGAIELTPQYITVFSYGSFLQQEVIPATK